MTSFRWRDCRAALLDSTRQPTCNRVGQRFDFSTSSDIPSVAGSSLWFGGSTVRSGIFGGGKKSQQDSRTENNWRSSSQWNAYRLPRKINPNDFNFHPRNWDLRPQYSVKIQNKTEVRWSQARYSSKSPFVVSQSSNESSDSFEGVKPHPLSRRGSTIYPLRTFNNWAKAILIQHAIPDSIEEKVSVMDLGCCKGVDLKKWAHSKVKYVYLVEENEEELDECRRRYIEIRNR